MKTIEERAIAYRDDVRSGKYGITVTDAYIQGATEQKVMDDKECMTMVDAAVKEAKQVFIDKACEWMKVHVATAYIDMGKGGLSECHCQDWWLDDFRKAMEE